MVVNRITREEYSNKLTGEGAKKAGGRWNPKGLSVIYTSDTVSLAALEVLVNTPTTRLPKDLVLVSIEIACNIFSKEIAVDQLSKEWRANNSKTVTKQIGREWLKSNESLILKVPPVVIPSEKNILLNPGHENFSKVKVIDVSRFQLDSRLLD